jgi:hypothetical protein
VLSRTIHSLYRYVVGSRQRSSLQRVQSAEIPYKDLSNTLEAQDWDFLKRLHCPADSKGKSTGNDFL